MIGNMASIYYNDGRTANGEISWRPLDYTTSYPQTYTTNTTASPGTWGWGRTDTERLQEILEYLRTDWSDGIGNAMKDWVHPKWDSKAKEEQGERVDTGAIDKMFDGE